MEAARGWCGDVCPTTGSSKNWAQPAACELKSKPAVRRERPWPPAWGGDMEVCTYLKIEVSKNEVLQRHYCVWAYAHHLLVNG